MTARIPYCASDIQGVESTAVVLVIRVRLAGGAWNSGVDNDKVWGKVPKVRLPKVPSAGIISLFTLEAGRVSPVAGVQDFPRISFSATLIQQHE